MAQPAAQWTHRNSWAGPLLGIISNVPALR